MRTYRDKYEVWASIIYVLNDDKPHTMRELVSKLDLRYSALRKHVVALVIKGLILPEGTQDNMFRITSRGRIVAPKLKGFIDDWATPLRETLIRRK